MKITVTQLVSVEDGFAQTSLHRNTAAAQAEARAAWQNLIKSWDYSDHEYEDIINDWECFTEALADEGVDITIETFTIDTDNFDTEED